MLDTLGIQCAGFGRARASARHSLQLLQFGPHGVPLETPGGMIGWVGPQPEVQRIPAECLARLEAGGGERDQSHKLAVVFSRADGADIGPQTTAHRATRGRGVTEGEPGTAEQQVRAKEHHMVPTAGLSHGPRDQRRRRD